MIRALSLSILLMLSQLTWANPIEVHEFASAAQEQRYRALIDELRCPKCQNQNLAGSDAPLARDLRQKVFEQLQDGQSEHEIRQYMIDRYGDFVTYKPPIKPQTLLLWGLPWALVAVAGGLLFMRRARKVTPAAPLSAAEQQQVEAILGQPASAAPAREEVSS